MKFAIGSLRARTRRSVLALMGASMLLTSWSTSAQSTDSSRALGPILEAYWPGWLDEVAALITVAEREQFLQLSTDSEREAFRRHFWRLRDPEPTTHGNPLREQFLRNVQLAWDAIGSMLDARAQTIVLHGPPRYAYHVDCAQLMPLQLLYFPATPERQSFQVLYARPRGATSGYRLWRGRELAELVIDPSLLVTLPETNGPSAPDAATEDNSNRAILERLAAQGCFREEEHLLGYLNGALDNAIDWTEVSRRASFPTPSPQQIEGWTRHREAGAADVPVVPAHRLSLAYAPNGPSGFDEEATVLQGKLQIPLDRSVPDRREVDRWILRGEILPVPEPNSAAEASHPPPSRRKERFRQIVYLPSESTGQTSDPDSDVTIVFVRDLAPGRYELVLNLETLDGDPVLRTHRPIVVPAPSELAPGSSTGPSPRTEFTAATLRLEVPDGVLDGSVEVGVRVTGPSIASVRYELDGRVVAHQAHAPWAASIELGPHPQPHSLTATGLDRDGRVVASDSLDLNAGQSRFAVVLAEPWKGAHNEEDLRARAAVHVPPGATVDRVDFFLGEVPLGTLFQEPFVLTVPAHSADGPTYVRAVARLGNGSTASDTVLVNSPGHMDEIQVREVELFAKIFRRKRPVEDLTVQEVVVRENGARQQIDRFEHVRELPIHLGLVIDSSTSMLEELPVCVASAVRFFEETLGEDDQASVIAFNQRTQLAVPLTSDLGWLSDGVSMLHPRGGTALWDSLINSLNYFGGLPGKRALVLISDGGDQHSQFTFQDSLQFARRSGISVYTFFLNVAGTDPNGLIAPGLSGWPTARISPAELTNRRERQSRLEQLARETGGRFFLIGGRRSIDNAFQAVAEDVRSQYLITYQSSNQGSGYREVEVEAKRPGLKVRTLRGYYP